MQLSSTHGNGRSVWCALIPCQDSLGYQIVLCRFNDKELTKVLATDRGSQLALEVSKGKEEPCNRVAP
jgi:hypothetical protein